MTSNELFQKKAPGAPVAVKICGVTVEDEARAIADLGAEMMGFNFWPKSKRHIGRVEDHPWIRDIEVRRVGVFVDASREEIVALWKGGWIEAAQLHGDESVEFARALHEEGVPVIKAIGIADETSPGKIEAFGELGAVLVDAYAPDEKGGTGRLADWQLAREAMGRLAHGGILAGGLTAENVDEAVRAVRPDAVDVASGVESSPGRKDLEKVRLFVERAKGAGKA